MQAGDLRERFGFYPRTRQAIDAYGNEEAAVSENPAFVVWAALRPKLGGEEVLAARLVGKNSANITVRRSPDTAKVTAGWVAEDQSTKEKWNIRSVVDPDGSGAWVEMLAEKGVAT